MTLRLHDLEPFAIGGTRRCYVHPDDETRCVKVLRTDRTPQARRAVASGWRRFKGLASFDDQRKETKAYRHLRRRGQLDYTHVPRFYGTVETDQGAGIVTALFRDYDGGYPKNLEELLPLGMTDALEQAISEFKQWLRRELFLTRDLLPHNIIAVAARPARYRLVIVDGIGNSEFIPLSHWFTFCARAKIERKIRKFDYRTRILLPERPPSREPIPPGGAPHADP
ncbi:MAG: YrbL family protein [Gammaproteobacteria bacterium]|nr:YrbL family protein [Gammaproteobacteria bacterium]